MSKEVGVDMEERVRGLEKNNREMYKLQARLGASLEMMQKTLDNISGVLIESNTNRVKIEELEKKASVLFKKVDNLEESRDSSKFMTNLSGKMIGIVISLIMAGMITAYITEAK